MYYDRVNNMIVGLLGHERHDVELSLYTAAGQKCFNKSYRDVSAISENISQLGNDLLLCHLRADELTLVNKIHK